jgi:tRNA U34 5-methylaminomethyl-2-thiouridine-forming methyltransferase MnmC
MEELILVRTNDGSHTIYVPAMNEHYHSIHGAVTESLHVFIREGFLRLKNDPVRIFEVGFGTGLNALLTLLNAEDHHIMVEYHTIDIHPLPVTILEEINYPEVLKMKNRDVFMRLHEVPWHKPVRFSDHFTLYKILGDITLHKWDQSYNLCYFDAFGPDKQPAVWTRSILQSVYESLEDGGMLVTYSAKGTFRRTLSEIGFRVEKKPGPGVKRHMTAAIKL